MRQGRRQVRIEVFNPSDFRDDVEVFGSFYHFEAMGVGTCGCAEHNVKGSEDNVGCHEVLDYPRDEKNRLQFDLERRVANDGTATADAVADFIVSTECRGGKGFVRLEGSEGERAAQKAKARETWVGLYILQVEEAIALWEAHVAALKATTPGSPAPRRPRDIAEKYEWRRRHHEIVDTPRGKQICASCGADYDSAKDLASHITDEHPGIAHEGIHAGVFAAVAAAKPTATPGPVPPAPTDPPPVPVPEEIPNDPEMGQRLLARAKTVGVELSMGDRKGLTFGDPDVLQDVSDRLEAVAKKIAAEKRSRVTKPEPVDVTA